MESKVGCDGDMDSLRATELRLGPPGENEPQKTSASRSSKRALAAGEQEKEESSSSACARRPDQKGAKEEAAPRPPAKAQVVGWPPIRSFRKNCLQAAAKTTSTEADAPAGGSGGVYVKVSMDGAPYVRKVDLRSYGGYRELRQAMEAMFKCFSTGTVEGRCSSSGSSSSEYVVTYEDKDGDWMLAGDVPWEMFACSCRRLRIMRGSEARGLGSSRT